MNCMHALALTHKFGMLTTRLQDRRRSSIPKTAEVTPKHQSEGNQYWEYPSQQMFFNAMKRKGHAPVEGEMSTIVGMHNAVNEKVCSLGGCSHGHVVKWHPRQCFNLIDKHSIQQMFTAALRLRLSLSTDHAFNFTVSLPYPTS